MLTTTALPHCGGYGRAGRLSTPSCLLRVIVALTILSWLGSETSCLHLKGSFSNADFYKFLVKFGFQKTDLSDKENTQGYIYGNITTKGDAVKDVDYDMYFVVVERHYFVELYAFKDSPSTPGKCTDMFREIDKIAWDTHCYPKRPDPKDFLRRIPCPVNGVCLEEQPPYTDPIQVIPGSQLTFHIVDPNVAARFWYISLVACHRPRKARHCRWVYNSSLDLVVDYDIWFVNGNPDSKHLNPFEHQFSFEMHDVLEIYMAFFVLNLGLLVIQLWVFRKTKHLLVWLVTAVISLEVLGIFFNLLHITVFAANGEGVVGFKIFGNFLDTCAQSAVMLEILYIAKGWTISTQTLKRKLLLYITWIIYTIIYIVLFSVNLVAVDPILDTDEWQTTPGYCIIVFRVVIMGYFLFELQDTIGREDSPQKRRFYTRVGAGFLVWFVYLPIVALVSPKIAALWRFKTLLSIQSGADFALLAILLHLFWPSDSVQYFNIPNSDHRPAPISDTTNLVSEAEEQSSSEDELYERQAQQHLNAHSHDTPSYTAAVTRPTTGGVANHSSSPNGNFLTKLNSRLHETSF